MRTMYVAVRIGAHQIRSAVFSPASRRRGGLNADEVHAFLQRVADEIARLNWEVNAARAETDRIKGALHAWQSAHAATCVQPMTRS